MSKRSPVPILTHYRDLPYTRLLVWFPGGSSREAASELGWAHLIEHLLFKLRHDGATLAEFVEGLGGHSNAFTSHDTVVVEVSVRTDDVDRVLKYLSATLSTPLTTIGERDFEEERGVVIEELRMYRDEPSENLFTTAMKNLFPGHPYGREIIGEEETLQGATLAKLERFLRGKLSVKPFAVIAGGYTGKGRLELPQTNEVAPLILDPWTTEKRFRLTHRQNKDYFLAAWRLPPETGELLAALRLIHAIVHGMDGSRFYNSLVYESGTFDNMAVSVINGLSGICFLQSVACDPTREARRIARWMKEWRRLDFTQSELARAREVLYSEECYAAEGVGGVADAMGRSYLQCGDPYRLERDQFWHLFHLSAADLRAFKDKYLSLDDAVIGAALPEKSRFSFAATKAGNAPVLPAEEEGLRVEKKHVRYTLMRRDSAPFVSIYALKKCGVMGDIPGKAGSMRLMLEVLTTSAAGMDKESTEEFLDRFGITLSPVAGNNTGGIRLRVRDSFLNEAVDILDRILHNPLLQEDFSHEKDYTLNNLSLKRESPEALLRERIPALLFAGTAYDHPLEGTLDSVGATTFRDLRAVRRSFFAKGRWGLGVSGAADPSLADRIAALLPRHHEEPFTEKRRGKAKLDDRIVTVPVPGKQQIHIARLFKAPGIFADDFETMRLIEQLLIGQRSPYFQALREEAGLVYSLDVWGMGGITEGYMALYAITSPANKAEVMRRMESTVELLRTGGIAQDYLDEVKNGLRFEHARSLVRNEFHAFNLALEEALDMPYGNYRRLPETLDTITRDKVVACAKNYFGRGLWLVSGGNDEKK